MKQDIIDEFNSPALHPQPEDYEVVRTFVTERERRPYQTLTSSELKRFWRSLDRIIPGMNRWDYRLLTFMAGALFTLGVQFLILFVIDLIPADDRTWPERAVIRLEGILTQPPLYFR